MATDWPSGSVFAIGWLLLWCPIFTIAMYWFYVRSEIQPIKARSPRLVLITDGILLLYTISLCFQRIIVNDYPCLLNMWSGYIGTVVLFNSYLWRCWTLYFNFNLTHVRLQSHRSINELDQANFFIKNRYMTNGVFLSKIAGGILLVLMMPPLALSVTHPFIADEYGDGCNQVWGPTLLAVYVAAYVALFSWFSFSLRSVVDGFKIKMELKITGFIALLAVIPWFVFNTYLKTINTDVFPFSTMFILIAIVAAFCASTMYPLYASIWVFNTHTASSTAHTKGMGSSAFSFHPLASSDPSSPDPTNGEIETFQHPDRLYKILEDPSGLEAFTQFLMKEFSVENILFYKEIERFRHEIRQAMEQQHLDTNLRIQFIKQSKKIHAKYIAVGSSYQVNLPDPVVRNCEAHLRYEAHLHGVTLEPMGAPTKKPHAGASASSSSPNSLELEDFSSPPPQQPPMDHLDKMTPTLFDDSQRTIYVLMEKDSMLRFVRSELYKKWFEARKEEFHKNQVLAEMNLV